MTNINLTDLTIVADSSGSMHSLVKDTVGSINKLIEDQKQLPGECTFNLLIFDNSAEWIRKNINVKEVAPITEKDYWKGGGTALYDAVAEAINKNGQRFASLKEEDRPGKVMVVIITDGEENSSHEFSRWNGGQTKLLQLVEQQKTKYNWQFVFLGAGLDAIKDAASIGIGAATAMSYNATSKGMHKAYASVSSLAGSLRSRGLGESLEINIPDEMRDDNSTGNT